MTVNQIYDAIYTSKNLKSNIFMQLKILISYCTALFALSIHFTSPCPLQRGKLFDRTYLPCALRSELFQQQPAGVPLGKYH